MQLQVRIQQNNRLYTPAHSLGQEQRVEEINQILYQQNLLEKNIYWPKKVGFDPFHVQNETATNACKVCQPK